MVLNLVGEIQEDVVVLKKCSGAMAGVVLAKPRHAKMFPGGEVETSKTIEPTTSHH
jgi:hypothetical protein